MIAARYLLPLGAENRVTVLISAFAADALSVTVHWQPQHDRPLWPSNTYRRLPTRPMLGQPRRGRGTTPTHCRHDPSWIRSSLAVRSAADTRGNAHRLYRHGSLEVEGFAIADISELLPQEGVTIWLDLHDLDAADLAVLTEEFGLHPLAVEDAIQRHERPKLDRYPDHLFLSAYAVRLDATTAQLVSSELACECREPCHRR